MNNYTSNINDFIHHISSIDHEPVSNLLYARTSRPLLDSVYAATEVSTQLQINRDLTEIRNFTDVPNSKPYEILHNNIKNGLTSLKRHRERIEIHCGKICINTLVYVYILFHCILLSSVEFLSFIHL